MREGRREILIWEYHNHVFTFFYSLVLQPKLRVFVFVQLPRGKPSQEKNGEGRCILSIKWVRRNMLRGTMTILFENGRVK